LKRAPLLARAVLFDWDGTLLDSAVADTRAYLVMFAALGISWTEADIARHYHPDWYRVYRAARIHRSRWDEANRLWREAYLRENPRLLPGARAVLSELSLKFTLGIVTSGDGTRVRLQLVDLGLANLFDVVICAEDARLRKPHPAPLRLALKRLGMTPDESVYVGDSGQDMEMAQRAGVRAIGIFGAFPTARALRAARPTLLLKSVKELPQYLVRMPAEAESAKRGKSIVRAAVAARRKARPKRRTPSAA
jgi:HAD superfamily hydrolase (TIGR01509 family)